MNWLLIIYLAVVLPFMIWLIAAAWIMMIKETQSWWKTR